MKKIKFSFRIVRTGISSGAIWLGEIMWDFYHNPKRISITILQFTITLEIWKR